MLNALTKKRLKLPSNLDKIRHMINLLKVVRYIWQHGELPSPLDGTG